MRNKEQQPDAIGKKREQQNVSLAPLDFEEALEDLLKIKPIENQDLRKAAPNKKEPV